MSARRRLLFALAALGIAVIAVLIVNAAGGHSSHAPRTFEIEMRASAGTIAQLFWSDDLNFVEERSIRVSLPPAAQGFQRLHFLLPSHGVRWLRFDPTDAPAEILIAKVNVLDSNGQALQTLDPGIFTAANQSASITRQGEVTRVVTTPAANHPFLFAAVGCRLDSPSLWDRLALVTPTSLVLVSLAAISLLTACVVVIGRTAFGRGPDVGLSQTASVSWRISALWIGVLFLVVFSAKLLLMREFPLTVPFWDQWDAEARGLYVPFGACSLSWDQMFYLQNEHRVFFTRLLALALVVANGQWDPRLEQLVNAAMHTATAVLMVAMLWTANERRRLDLLVLVVVMMFALPFAWENTLLGFQSAFYFQLLFSILALWLMTTYRAGSLPWYLGWSCAACGVFSAAGGVITPLAIGGVVALKLVNDRREWREPLITLAAAGVVLAVGIAVTPPLLPFDAVYRVKTVADFAGALGRNLAWPWIEHPLLSLVMWLPIAVLLIVTILRRVKATVFVGFVIGLGAWVALQAAAIAFGRGAGAPAPGFRYQDFLSLGFLANTMALVVGLDSTRARTMARRLAMGALVSWLLVSIVGVGRLAEGSLIGLETLRKYWSADASNVRRFIIAGDLAEFVSKQPLNELPYPDARSLAAVLQDPYIRRILPATVRAPVHVEPRVVTNKAFVPEGTYPITPRDPLARGWGSYTAQGNPAQGRFESQPIDSCQSGGRLQFQVAGYLGLPQQYLAVKDLWSGRELEVRPSRLARESWLNPVVACPAGPYAIVAVDGNPDYWFAFREPVEVGWASVMAESLIAASSELLLVALGMAMLAARLT